MRMLRFYVVLTGHLTATVTACGGLTAGGLPGDPDSGKDGPQMGEKDASTGPAFDARPRDASSAREGSPGDALPVLDTPDHATPATEASSPMGCSSSPVVLSEGGRPNCSNTACPSGTVCVEFAGGGDSVRISCVGIPAACEGDPTCGCMTSARCEEFLGADICESVVEAATPYLLLTCLCN
jgi:hypothetical protein